MGSQQSGFRKKGLANGVSTFYKRKKQRIQSGHLTKSHLCNLGRGCLPAEGPRRIHRRIRDVNKDTHALHLDIAGPLTKSDDEYVFFLVGALRLPGFSFLIDVRLLQTRVSAEVCHQLDVTVNYFVSLCFEEFPITDEFDDFVVIELVSSPLPSSTSFLHIDEVSTTL